MENYRTYEQKHEDLGYTIAQFFHFYYHTVSKFEDYRIHPHHPDDKFNQQPTIYGRTPFSSNNEDKLEIIDPLNPKNNVGKSSFNIDEIKECFKESWEVLYWNTPELNKMYDEWIKKVMTI